MKLLTPSTAAPRQWRPVDGLRAGNRLKRLVNGVRAYLQLPASDSLNSYL